MAFKKSPFPYIFILTFILGIAFYSNSTLDKKINAPITYSLHKKQNTLNAKLPDLTPPLLTAITATETIITD